MSPLHKKMRQNPKVPDGMVIKNAGIYQMVLTQCLFISGYQVLNKKIDEQTFSNPEENQQKGITLSTLLGRVTGAVSNEFKIPVWVNCEIAALNTHRSGHLYLELIETDSNGREICKNKAIIWKSVAPTLIKKFKDKTGEELKDGMKVLLLAEVEFNITFGLSLKITDIDPEFTLGELKQR